MVRIKLFHTYLYETNMNFIKHKFHTEVWLKKFM